MEWHLLLQQYGYFLLFLLLVIEGQPFIILAGFLIYLGVFKFWAVIAVGLPALILGDLIFHYLAYKWGRTFINKYDRFLFITPPMFIKLEKFFAKHGGKVIIFTKFIYGLGRNILIVAGLSGRQYRKLFKYDLLGCAISILFFSTLGYLFGQSYELLESYLRGLGLILIGLILIFFICWRLGLQKVIKKLFKDNGNNKQSVR